MKTFLVEDLENYPDRDEVEMQLASTPIECESRVLRELQAYYNSKVGAVGGMPSRQNISPADIHKILENIFLVELRGDPALGASSFFYRVMGSKLAELDGQDLSQQSLGEYKCGNRRARSAMIYSYVARTKKPARAVGHIQNAIGKVQLIETVTFPLSNDGVNVNMLIGGLAFLER